jgi:hypothetical protein
MKPVSGEGRVSIRNVPHESPGADVACYAKIKMNSRLDKDTPRFDVQLFFDEIGVVVDNHQYRDVISLLDMFHFYARHHQV